MIFEVLSLRALITFRFVVMEMMTMTNYSMRVVVELQSFVLGFDRMGGEDALVFGDQVRNLTVPSEQFQVVAAVDARQVLLGAIGCLFQREIPNRIRKVIRRMRCGKDSPQCTTPSPRAAPDPWMANRACTLASLWTGPQPMHRYR